MNAPVEFDKHLNIQQVLGQLDNIKLKHFSLPAHQASHPQSLSLLPEGSGGRDHTGGAPPVARDGGEEDDWARLGVHHDGAATGRCDVRYGRYGTVLIAELTVTI